ncbi:MAG: hypothetical protein K2L99_09055, partial [Muribaculaceae bacterium]|nr:hypothetical protein [Muribaculaceae bacterium]
ISAVTGQGIPELKDLLWRAITDENNRLATPDIARRDLDEKHRVREEDEFIFSYVPGEGDEEDYEGEDLQHIDPASWGEDEDDSLEDTAFFYGDEDVEPED